MAAESGEDQSAGLLLVRYGIPALLILAGLAALLFGPDGAALEGWALFTGAGLSVLLLNVLYRVGVRGDVRRRLTCPRVGAGPTSRVTPHEASQALQTRSAEPMIPPMPRHRLDDLRPDPQCPICGRTIEMALGGLGPIPTRRCRAGHTVRFDRRRFRREQRKVERQLAG